MPRLRRRPPRRARRPPSRPNTPTDLAASRLQSQTVTGDRPGFRRHLTGGVPAAELVGTPKHATVSPRVPRRLATRRQRSSSCSTPVRSSVSVACAIAARYSRSKSPASSGSRTPRIDPDTGKPSPAIIGRPRRAVPVVSEPAQATLLGLPGSRSHCSVNSSAAGRTRPALRSRPTALGRLERPCLASLVPSVVSGCVHRVGRL